MDPSDFRKRLADGDVVLGLAVTYAAPGIVEAICRGWDFVWLCGQHGEFDVSTMRHAVRAAELAGAASVVRVPGHDYAILGPFADLAPTALMVPMVDTPEQAEHIARSLRFPRAATALSAVAVPLDKWGIQYTTEQPPYILAQIETPEAVENAPAIAAVPDIEMLFFSPGDMRLHLGIPITPGSYIADERMRHAMQATADAARQAGKAAGCIATTPELMETALDMGYQLVNCGVDCTFLNEGARQAHETQYAALARLLS